MSVKIKQQNKTLIIEVGEEIDHHYASKIKDKLDKEINRTNAKNLIFDFKDVAFMDSSGIGMIIGRYKLIENKGGKVYAVNINASLNRIFEISGLLKIINIANNVEEVLD